MCPLERQEARPDDRTVEGSGSRLAALRPRAFVALGLIALALGIAGAATGAMRSEKLAPRLCETTGGGKIVRIPGFPGERIDRRLLADIAYLRERFKIFITDGYSTDPVHSANGEHPLGLALDIVPDFANGGKWRKISRLARWAEPKQDRPRAPFRWVGYNGDANHGRGHHLHLSYSHSPRRSDGRVRMVQTIKCPSSGTTKPPPPPAEEPGEDSGGVGYSRADLERLERKHPETGGVGID